MQLHLQFLVAMTVAAYANANSCGGSTEPTEPGPTLPPPVELTAEGFMSSKSQLQNQEVDGHLSPASAACILGPAGGVFFDAEDSNLIYAAVNVPEDFEGKAWYEWFTSVTIDFTAGGSPRTCLLQTEDLSGGECETSINGWCTRNVTVRDIELISVDGVTP